MEYILIHPKDYQIYSADFYQGNQNTKIDSIKHLALWKTSRFKHFSECLNYRCRCGINQECVYDRTDMKMRLYRQMCVHREKLQERDEDFTDRKFINF